MQYTIDFGHSITEDLQGMSVMFEHLKAIG